MIHYITVAVALERPPTEQEYRRYAIYGGTHAEAQLVALQMASCTSVMPVSVVRDGGCYGDAPCTPSPPLEPHGALGCRCWTKGAVDPGYHYDEDDAWQIDQHCPWHGTHAIKTECPYAPGSPACAGGKCSCNPAAVAEAVMYSDCHAVDPEVYMDCECTVDVGCQAKRAACPCPNGNDGVHPHIPGEVGMVCTPDPVHVCETSRCWQECQRRPAAGHVDNTDVHDCPGCVDSLWPPSPAPADSATATDGAACINAEEESKCNSASPLGQRILAFLTRALKRSKD